MFEFFKNLDRRWIFLLMFLAASTPIIVIGITNRTFPEVPTVLAINTYEAIEALEPGAPVFLSFDFDPASEGELAPMATSFVRHCCERGLRLYFIALWPVGPQMIDDAINDIIEKDFPEMEYGVHYVNLGFKAGNEVLIKNIVNDLRQEYEADSYGTALEEIPMMEGIDSVRDSALLINISAGYPGTKEWVQYAATPYPDDITIVAGCTGVQAPLLYPYIPEQLPGLLGAIKGAAEYEALVNETYSPEGDIAPKYLEAQRRMGPQLVAHVLMIILIIAGNIIFFMDRKRGGRR